jgi:vacuolar protein sorting-associated protein 45
MYVRLIPDFTNHVSNAVLESMANADEKSAIEQVKEIYIDYFVVDPDFYILKSPTIADIGLDEFKESQKEFLKHTEDSLFAVCMALRRVPNITYSLESRIGRKLSERLSSRLEREYTQNHRDFLQESLDLVILDRRDDALTPLVYNWSYLPMVNEFIGISNNSVLLDSTGNPKAKPLVFSRQTEDTFIEKNWNKNFGEFTTNLTTELENMCKEKHMAVKLDSLEDMQRAMEKLPDLSKDAEKLKKHSDIIRFLTDQVSKNDIYSVSQLQQDIITENNKQQQLKDLLQIFLKKEVRSIDKLKLAMIYCLKYPDDPERVNGIQRAAQAQNLSVVVQM